MLPVSVTLGAHVYRPRLPSFPLLMTYARSLPVAPVASVEWTEIVLSTLDACHPGPKPWGAVKGDLSAVGRAVGAWAESVGLAPMDVWAAADELAAEVLRATAPPTKAAVEAAAGNSPAPAGNGSDGASSSPASGAETASAG